VRECDRVIAECPQDAADLVRLYDAEPARIRRVACGVDTETFRPGQKARARARLGLPAGDFIVLQLGRLVPRKGVDTVVRALARLPEPALPNAQSTRTARLVIVGGETAEPDPRATPEIARLAQIATAEGVAERVLFAGRRDRDALRDWYVAADAFVTTPWYEPFGITPLEAMACGTPVVGSRVGGIAHTVVDGVTGFLVPPRDPDALAQRLAWLRDDPRLATGFGLAGVGRVRTQFTWDIVARGLADVYAEVVDGTEAAPLVARVAAAAPRRAFGGVRAGAAP
jgi:glycosyltransferase involved in cell wall biosynthesis